MLKTKGIIFKAAWTSFTVLLVSCSSQRAPIPQDPLEGMNRATFAFNNVVDKTIFKPTASIYDMIFPNFFKKGVDNFFRNLGETYIIANNILQTEYYAAFQDFGRLAFNTTFGLGGLVDVATEVNIPRNYQDFGLTFARWGVKNSDYLVLPILGPSTIRDAIGFGIDYEVLTPYTYFVNWQVTYSLDAVNLIDVRTQLLPSDPLIAQSFDPYTFVRDAYLQNRSYLIGLQTTPEAVDTYVEEYRPMRPGVSAAPTGEDTYVPAEEPVKTKVKKK
jgi:phospholipid-binding lipoprotein MlaA